VLNAELYLRTVALAGKLSLLLTLGCPLSVKHPWPSVCITRETEQHTGRERQVIRKEEGKDKFQVRTSLWLEWKAKLMICHNNISTTMGRECLPSCCFLVTKGKLIGEMIV
jgi:hypothetical protein